MRARTSAPPIHNANTALPPGIFDFATAVADATRIAVDRGFVPPVSLGTRTVEKDLFSWLAQHRRTGDPAVGDAMSALYESRQAVETAARESSEVRTALADRSRFPLGSWVVVFDGLLHGPFGSQDAVNACTSSDAQHFPIAAYAWQIETVSSRPHVLVETLPSVSTSLAGPILPSRQDDPLQVTCRIDFVTAVADATRIAVDRGFVPPVSLGTRTVEKDLFSWLAQHRRTGDPAVGDAMSALYESRQAVETAARESSEVRTALADRSRFPLGSWVVVFDGLLHGPFGSQDAVNACTSSDAQHFPIAAYAWQIGNEGGPRFTVGDHSSEPLASILLQRGSLGSNDARPGVVVRIFYSYVQTAFDIPALFDTGNPFPVLLELGDYQASKFGADFPVEYGASGFATVTSVMSKIAIVPLSTSPQLEVLGPADTLSVWAVCRHGETPLPYANVGLLALRDDEIATISRGVVTFSCSPLIQKPHCCVVQ